MLSTSTFFISGNCLTFSDATFEGERRRQVTTPTMKLCRLRISYLVEKNLSQITGMSEVPVELFQSIFEAICHEAVSFIFQLVLL